MDFDELLSLEEQYYQDGYDHGKNEIMKETYTSGKMLGIQTGYQKLVQLGMVYAYLEALKKDDNEKKQQLTKENNNNRNSSSRKIKGKLSNDDLALLEAGVFNNDDESIEKLEKLIKKCKNWMMMNGALLPKDRNAVIAQIVGELPKNSNDLGEW